MLSLSLVGGPRGLVRERALTAILLLCMTGAIVLQIAACALSRLSSDGAVTLPDGSRMVLTDRHAYDGTPPAPVRDDASARLVRGTATIHRGSGPSESIVFVDPGFAEVFRLTSCRGSVEYALSRGNEVVLTEAAARRLFGTTDPVGRSLVMTVGDDALALRVGAVACDRSAARGLGYAMLAALDPFLLGWSVEERASAGRHLEIETYTRQLAPSPMNGILGLARDPWIGRAAWRSVAPSIVPEAAEPDGSAASAIRAAFAVVLLQALAWGLARSMPARREAALYRRCGRTSARQLAAILIDAAILTSTAALIAVAVVEWRLGGSLPYGGPDGVLATLAECFAALLCALSVVPLLVTLPPLRRLRRRARTDGRTQAAAIALQSVIVLGEIGVAAALLSASIPLLKSSTLLAADAGYDPRGVVVIGALTDPTLNAAQREAVLRTLARLPGVTGVGAATPMFGPAVPRVAVIGNGRRAVLPVSDASEAALATLGVKPLRGRLDQPGIVLTAHAARLLGFADPAAAVGTRLSGDMAGEVVAVVRDVRFGPGGAGVSAALFRVAELPSPKAVALIRTTSISTVLPAIRQAWARSAPAVPFDATPIADVERGYRSTIRKAAGFVAAALAIACLATLAGVFGLIAGLRRSRSGPRPSMRGRRRSRLGGLRG